MPYDDKIICRIIICPMTNLPWRQHDLKTNRPERQHASVTLCSGKIGECLDYPSSHVVVLNQDQRHCVLMPPPIFLPAYLFTCLPAYLLAYLTFLPA